MATGCGLLAVLVLLLLVVRTYSEVAFESLCSSEVEVAGLSSIDGDDEFEIDLYESKFLPDDTILLAIKQKRQNYGVNEFALRAFDYDGNVIGRFDDQQSGSLALKHHTCPNGATVIYVDKVENRGYREIPLSWKATGVHSNLDEIVFKADIVSNRQIYRVKSVPLRRRLASGMIPYAADQSINIDSCGETQGCLIVPEQCNSDAKCEYTLSWQVLDDAKVKFHIIARAQGFVGIGFSADEKRGDDQVVICTKDLQGYVYIHNMFVGVQTPQYIVRERPSYGLRETDGYSNTTHIICKFVRSVSANAEAPVEQDGQHRHSVNRGKLVDLKRPHHLYPIYSDQDLMTPQGMRIPVQDIAIVNNHAIDFDRRIWPKSHPRAGSLFAKLHAILNIIAWILFASAGVIIARYFDSVSSDYERRVVVDGSGVSTVEKPRVPKRVSYFWILPSIMTITAILTWIAFFCIFFELDWKWTEGTHHMWHSILGSIVLVSAFLVPMISFLQPRPRTKRYCFWYWLQWFIISLAHFLAIPVISLGMDNRRLDLWTWCSWLLFGWCIFHTIVLFIFEIHACFHRRQEYDRFEDGSYHAQPKQGNRRGKERSNSESWKRALLSIHMAVTLLVVIVLIVAIILYQGY